MINLGYRMSEIDRDIAKQHMNIEDDFVEDDMIIDMYIGAAKSYICKYTNRDTAYLDGSADYAVVCLALVSDFYENRQINVGENCKINKILECILSMDRDLG